MSTSGCGLDILLLRLIFDQELFGLEQIILSSELLHHFYDWIVLQVVRERRNLGLKDVRRLLLAAYSALYSPMMV